MKAERSSGITPLESQMSGISKELEMQQPNSDVSDLLCICVFLNPKCGTADSSQQQKEYVSIRLELSGDRHSLKTSQLRSVALINQIVPPLAFYCYISYILRGKKICFH